MLKRLRETKEEDAEDDYHRLERLLVQDPSAAKELVEEARETSNWNWARVYRCLPPKAVKELYKIDLGVDSVEVQEDYFTNEQYYERNGQPPTTYSIEIRQRIHDDDERLRAISVEQFKDYASIIGKQHFRESCAGSWREVRGYFTQVCCVEDRKQIPPYINGKQLAGNGHDYLIWRFHQYADDEYPELFSVYVACSK